MRKRFGGVSRTIWTGRMAHVFASLSQMTHCAELAYHRQLSSGPGRYGFERRAETDMSPDRGAFMSWIDEVLVASVRPATVLGAMATFPLVSGARRPGAVPSGNGVAASGIVAADWMSGATAHDAHVIRGPRAKAPPEDHMIVWQRGGRWLSVRMGAGLPDLAELGYRYTIGALDLLAATRETQGASVSLLPGHDGEVPLRIDAKLLSDGAGTLVLPCFGDGPRRIRLASAGENGEEQLREIALPPAFPAEVDLPRAETLRAVDYLMPAPAEPVSEWPSDPLARLSSTGWR